MIDLDSSRRPGADDVVRQLADGAAAQAVSENFPVALRVLPARARDLLAREYAFARFVDDVGDEAPGDRLALLDRLDEDIDRLPAGAALAPIAGMRPLVEQAGVPLRLLHDLVEANRRDQAVRTYPDFAALVEYCHYSADPIGRMVLHVAGRATVANLEDSDRVCTALQVLEHCQDVGEDAARGRVYLPADDLAAHGVGPDELTGAHTSPQLRAVVALQVRRAEDLLAAGRPLVARLRGWARVAVAGYVAGGVATAHALRGADHAVLESLVKPTKSRTLAAALPLVAGR